MVNPFLFYSGIERKTLTLRRRLQFDFYLKRVQGSKDSRDKKCFEWFSLVEDPVIFDGEPSNPPIFGP
jgi:hypothetical protein